MARTRVVVAAVAAVAGLMALSGCTKQVDSTPVAVEKPVEQQAVVGVKLAVAEVGPLGAVVTDQNGRTLYRFDKDKNKPSASNCNADCTKAWPPFVVADPAKVELGGVDQKLVGTVKRADGTVQLTLNGWPLYRSTKDSKAGDFNGQGINGTWFASTPQGKKAEATQPAPAADGGSGY
jgi:predicted lipoprotein with Yx(FWY)xxD motif